MAKVSKTILLGYNKCIELAIKWTNILDSFWHKDEKIPKSALREDVFTPIVDNLESSDTDKTLSANQGKVLNAIINGLSTNHVGDNSDLGNVVLNGFYPIANYPVGTIHIDKNSEWVGLYARITATEWLKFETQDSLETYFDSRYIKKLDTKKFVDEDGLTLMEVPFNEKINLHGVKAGYDLAKGGYYLESILDAPYLDAIEPVSMLPSTTQDIILYGSSFTRSTTVTTENSNITINNIWYELHVELKIPIIRLNVTSTSVEGDITFIIDNGKKEIVSGYFSIILGEVFQPTVSDWINISGATPLSTGSIGVGSYNSYSEALWDKEFDYTKDFMVSFKYVRSPLGLPNDAYTEPIIRLLSVVDDTEDFGFVTYQNSDSFYKVFYYEGGTLRYGETIEGGVDFSETFELVEDITVSIKFIGGYYSYYHNDNLIKIRPYVPTHNFKLMFASRTTNIKDIKYIELQTP
ncbi:hypothetical protein MC378_10475 [Polaribacter sp. MSW13]|uniref:Uncharacterized protein n=1 Tax=Polaribacter marinus TaxID=2916838 RepID=A0A9X1VP14_9FLAO|nr:hypothetical protein [Polaribacter marinus]MCI2229593.1 hypothetical protein [Polaribacter marinus]